MFLATSKVEDFDRWWSVFSTTSLEKRKQHGSKGSQVFHDPNEQGRVWVLFDWDAEGWQNVHLRPRGTGHPSTSRARKQATGLRSPPESSTASSSPRAGVAEEGHVDPEAVLLGDVRGPA